MESFAQAYLNAPTIASALAGMAMFATIMSLTMPLLKGDKLETRLKAVTSQREKLRKQSRARLEEKSIRREAKGAMADVTKKLNLATLLEDPNVEQKLAQAGFRGPKPIATFYFFRFSLPFLGALLAFFYIFFVNDFGLASIQKYGAILFGAALGFYAPTLYVSNVKQTRQKSIMKAFPDALDMMLICVESGMSIEMAFAKVGSEVGSASAELAEELTLTTAELSYLPERRMAYENLAKRTGHEGVKSVCMALVQGERYGTPLGDALRVMAKENREMRMSEAEKKAASLPAKLTVPMIVFFLPVLFLVVLGPAYIKFQEM
ncbi:MAG: type II secretion system F family protein [Hyphomonadaceae bacterium]|nr:type II secretion system F family protein [Hyphomonadaceae bacterium]